MTGDRSFSNDGLLTKSGNQEGFSTLSLSKQKTDRKRWMLSSRETMSTYNMLTSIKLC